MSVTSDGHLKLNNTITITAAVILESAFSNHWIFTLRQINCMKFKFKFSYKYQVRESRRTYYLDCPFSL